MGRKEKSPTRTISNAGPRPRFIGRFPCTKSPKPIPFDSVSSLYGALWLEWRLDVVLIGFESQVDEYKDDDDLAEVRAITDYHLVHDTGQIGRVEVKYSLDSLSEEERSKLALLAAHARRAGTLFETVDRKSLEANGFIQTILLLRPYAGLELNSSILKRALLMFAAYESCNLWVWRQRARQHGVPIAYLYQLLYRQQLPLSYEPLIVWELSQCRA